MANILNISYEQALKEQCESSIKHNYGITSKQTIDYIMKKRGWEKQKQPRKLNDTKYKVNEIDEILSTDEMEEGVLVLMANHCTVVRDYCTEDIWDCSRKSVGNYWIKR